LLQKEAKGTLNGTSVSLQVADTAESAASVHSWLSVERAADKYNLYSPMTDIHPHLPTLLFASYFMCQKSFYLFQEETICKSLCFSDS
jgi:hypothetical protein